MPKQLSNTAMIDDLIQKVFLSDEDDLDEDFDDDIAELDEALDREEHPEKYADEEDEDLEDDDFDEPETDDEDDDLDDDDFDDLED